MMESHIRESEVSLSAHNMHMPQGSSLYNLFTTESHKFFFIFDAVVKNQCCNTKDPVFHDKSLILADFC